VRRLALLFGLAAVAMLANPYHLWIVDYWLKATMDATARAYGNEWEPTSLARPAGLLFFLSLVPLGAVALLAAARRVRPTWTDALLLACFGLFALISVRNTIWWGLVVPPLAAKYAMLALRRDSVAHHSRVELPLLNLAILSAVLLLVVPTLPWLRASNPFLPPELRGYLDHTHPVGVVDYLRRTGASGRLFARMEWGGYLEWELWPQLQPMLDARLEVRPPEVWQDYFAITDVRPGWQAILDRDRVDYVVLELSAYPELRAAVQGSTRWREVYRDSLAAVYARQ
jgi:hypothetical protein